MVHTASWSWLIKLKNVNNIYLINNQNTGEEWLVLANHHGSCLKITSWTTYILQGECPPPLTWVAWKPGAEVWGTWRKKTTSDHQTHGGNARAAQARSPQHLWSLGWLRPSSSSELCWLIFPVTVTGTWLRPPSSMIDSLEVGRVMRNRPTLLVMFEGETRVTSMKK